mgnify:CR=1 FL=1
MEPINWLRPLGVFVVTEESYGEIYRSFQTLNYNLGRQQYINWVAEEIFVTNGFELKGYDEDEHEELVRQVYQILEDIPSEQTMTRPAIISGEQSQVGRSHNYSNFYFYYRVFDTEIEPIDIDGTILPSFSIKRP